MGSDPATATQPASAPAELPWRRVLILLCAVFALVLIASADSLHALMLSLTDRATPLMRSHPALGAVVFVLLSALSAMLAFFSSAVLVPVALQVWGTWGTIGLLWLGWIVGGIAAYAIARTAGRPLVARLVNGELLGRYESALSDHTPLGLVVLFQLGLPSELPGYLLGLARYSPLRYLLALAIAEMPWAIVTVLLGTSLLDRRVPVLLGLGSAAALLSGLAFVALHRRLRAARADHGGLTP
jgi:uncharacterized membrane protein YdjX (TVP38/TMEM64 family)